MLAQCTCRTTSARLRTLPETQSRTFRYRPPSLVSNPARGRRAGVLGAGVEGDGRLRRGAMDCVDDRLEQHQLPRRQADAGADHHAVVAAIYQPALHGRDRGLVWADHDCGEKCRSRNSPPELESRIGEAHLALAASPKNSCALVVFSRLFSIFLGRGPGRLRAYQLRRKRK